MKTPSFSDNLYIRKEVKRLIIVFLVWIFNFCAASTYNNITGDELDFPERFGFIEVFFQSVFVITQAFCVYLTVF